MTYRTRTLTFLGCLMAIGAMPVFANEEDQARKACERVMALFDQQRVDAGQSPLELTRQCAENTRTTDYWECAAGRMKRGESFAFATSRCEKLDPRT